MHFDSTEPCKTPHKDEQRERLQLLFDRSFHNGDKAKLREQYKILRQLELNSHIDFENEPVNISALAENITVACDIIVSQTGTSFIYCGNDTSPVLCNPRFITKALLNLLSNAYLYGCENLVTVKTIEMNDFVRLEVQNGGAFLSNTDGKGLQFVRKVCEKSNSRFFIEQSPTETRATIIFRKTRNYKDLNSIDFYSLINDRLSPVYVELFGMEYHQNAECRVQNENPSCEGFVFY